MKVALLIPSTSKGRDWKTFQESYLFKHTIKTFLLTYNKEHEYKFFIGIDENDPIYDNEEVKTQIQRFVSIMKNVEIEFIYMTNIPKGHLTVMWNKLYDEALGQNYEYFFQCGDDVEFLEYQFIDKFVDCLRKNNNIGVTGYYQFNDSKYPLLTQTFVSKKHMDIFGFYFPEQLKNWYCDDWINQVYKKTNKFFPLLDSKIINKQTNQKARYSIPKLQTTRINLKKICDYLVDKHVCILKKFLENKN